MHILRNSQPIEIIGLGGTLPPGDWLFDDKNAFEMGLFAEPGTAKLLPYSIQLTVEAQNATSILLVRSGAIGDLLFLSPAIGALQIKYPKANIAIACLEKHWPVLQAVEVQTIAYPVAVDKLNDYALVIPLENVVELALDKHATDAFADELGVTVTDYKPVYRVTDREREWAVVNWMRANKPRVALQLRASSVLRDYHMENWIEVIKGLMARGWEVLLFGKKGQIPAMKSAPPELKDCSNLTFREAAAVLSTCDAFCGVDSAFLNLCPALGVPAIGLYGPIDWKTRIKEGNGQYALSGVGECAPCGWTHSRAGHPFPPKGACNRTGYCVPLAEIKPERVIAKIEGMLR